MNKELEFNNVSTGGSTVSDYDVVVDSKGNIVK